MDTATLQAYDASAAAFAVRFRQSSPAVLFPALPGIFRPSASTADVGCGGGRDVNWLKSLGYPTVGYDASTAMLQQARQAFPTIDVRQDSLPDLASIPDAAYGNVLCSATLMHVPREDLITAVLNLARVLQAGGRIYLTYRQSQALSEREDDGRLFTAMPTGQLILLLESAGFTVLLSSTQQDSTRPVVQWTVIVAEKSVLQVARGLDRIQSVLVQDVKVATYKLALFRALCIIGRSESHCVRWGRGEVYVPLRAIAVQWLIYYWPFVNSATFIAQIRGERANSAKPVAFRKVLAELGTQYGRGGLYALLRDLAEFPERFRSVLLKIAATIRDGPVSFAGTAGPKVFRYERALPTAASTGEPTGFGWVVVPEPIWLDISRFDHWIVDSIVLRWARLTADMNASSTITEYLPLLLDAPGDARDTTDIRLLLLSQSEPHECVWTGRAITDLFEVDHAIPYSVWGNNDLWNLLPTLPGVNNAKRDMIPTRQLLVRRRECIINYWHLYAGHWTQRFGTQLFSALGAVPDQPGWERMACAGLAETIERVAMTRGLARWEP